MNIEKTASEKSTISWFVHLREQNITVRIPVNYAGENGISMEIV